MKLNLQHIISKLLVFVLLLSLFSLKADDWELKRNKDGIKVYTRSIEESTFREFKAVSTLEGSITEIAAVIKDVPKTKVYELSKRYNEISGFDVIPKSGIKRAPTAEGRRNRQATD